ncbi:endonuclease VII domain-containing protein [Nocardia sp. NPDC056611]|uniref:endonuclease VII domain-containing protein n=1 Tax=Nocardia sp. NPDC056611 TaxID=3345877 RepID=UPI0036719268
MSLRECLCKVCDKAFQTPSRKGNFVAAYQVCPACAELHGWCSWCRKAHLQSEFPKEEGNRCIISGYRYTIESCGACTKDWIRETRSRRTRTRESLCHECSESLSTCSRCSRHLPFDQFQKRAERKSGVRSICRDCSASEWATRSPEYKTRLQLAKYGISWEQYQQMIADCDNRCAICGNHETELIYGELKALAIDHCHTTGQVRGLLCQACNQALGHMEDDPDRLIAAAEYLEKHAASPRLFVL